MPPILPSSSIDYKRPFSLPIGVPPDDIVLAGLEQYEAELGVELEFLELAWGAADPYISAEHPRDPFTSGLRVRFIRNVGTTGVVTLPTCLNLAGVPSTDMGTVKFRSAVLAPVGKASWSEAHPAGGESIRTAIARIFRWDDEEIRLWALPQPYFADEALCLYWPSSAAPTGALGTDIPGIFADDASSHLLATSATARDGELQPDLLRSPVRGLARFTRYRHVRFAEAGGTLSAPTVLTSSGAGSIILRALPPTAAVPSDPGAPLLLDTFLVFEHVDIQEASNCIAGLWWAQILRFAELEDIPQLKKPVRTSIAWALATYLALTTVQPPTIDAFGGLAPATRDKLRGATSAPDRTALHAALNYMLGDPARRSAFIDFLRTKLAPLTCGVSWAELRVSSIPAEPGVRTAANRSAHALLEYAQQAKDIWVAVYAGAPVGRPAMRFRAPSAGESVSTIIRNGFTTYDLEALILAGRAATMFPAIEPPASPATPDQPLPLTAYAGEASGRLAALRIADAAPGSIAYTMRDWLRHLVFGWQRTRAAEAPLDFGRMAVAGHPMTQSLNWDRRQKARALRTSLDQAHAAHNAAGLNLDRAAVTWWSTAVAFSTGMNWPLLLPGGSPGVHNALIEPPPSRTGETVGGTLIPSGFDEEDLELALEAREHLQSGHDTSQPIDLALILALLDREGYRMNGRYQRQGPFDNRLRDNLNGATFSRATFSAASLTKRGSSQGIGRVFYALQVFGLDVMDFRLLPASVSAVPNWLQFAWNNFFMSVTDSTIAGAITGLNTMGLNGRMLLRVTSEFDPVTTIGQSILRSRRVHLAGIIAQQGEYQRRHALLRRGSAAGPLNNWWQPSVDGTLLPDVSPFTTGLAPLIGANAEDMARRDFLAYYALCYLAFNGSPIVWKSWIDLAVALGAANVPRFLLYEITDADAVSGAVVPNPVNPATGQRPRELWHRGHFVRFAVALDAYLRMSDTGIGDVAFPARGGWGV